VLLVNKMLEETWDGKYNMKHVEILQNHHCLIFEQNFVLGRNFLLKNAEVYHLMINLTMQNCSVMCWICIFLYEFHLTFPLLSEEQVTFDLLEGHLQIDDAEQNASLSIMLN
jgi:hypothetical protein